MPLARLAVPSSLSAEKIRALADAVHDALVETCAVPPKDRFQLIDRRDPEAMILDRHFPDVERSAEASIVEILFIEGRTPAQKVALYRRIVERAGAAGLRGDDIMIGLVENARIDWSAGGGRAFEDPAS